MRFFYLFFEKATCSIWRHWSFRSYVKLNCNYGIKIRKEDSYIYVRMYVYGIYIYIGKILPKILFWKTLKQWKYIIYLSDKPH